VNLLPSGVLKSTHRARLFPLPSVLPFCKPPLRSARNRYRFKCNTHIINATNMCVDAINRLYYTTPTEKSFLSFSLFSTSHSSKQTDISPFSSPPSSCVSPSSCSSSSSSSLGQLRLLRHIVTMCARHVLTVRTWCHSESERDINTLVKSVVMDYRTEDATDKHDYNKRTNSSYALPRSANDFYSSADILPSLTAFSSSPSPVVPLIANRVSLPGPEKLNIVPMCKLLSPHIAQQYASPSSSASLLRPSLDVLELNYASPLRRPRVAGSHAEYVRLIGRLLEQGMVSFTHAPKAVNGVFTVAKDDDTDRLIIDAQPANRLFVDPPHVNLPDPSHIVQLQVGKGEIMFTGKSDLSNFYHHLGLPDWLQPYFALPPLSADELRSVGYEGEIRGSLYPQCVTVPMGWSHAVFVSQSSHENILYSAGVIKSDDNILLTSSPVVNHHRVLHGMVIDDFFLFSLNRRLASLLFARVLDAYRSAGLVVKQSKIVAPTADPVKVIGFNVDGRTHSVALPSSSLVDLLRVTLHVLRRDRVTGAGMAHLIGRWSWLMLLRRPSLAVLQHAYRFITVSRGRRFDLWPSVRRELIQLVGLVPLLRAQLDSPLNSHVVATDASCVGGGVVSTPLTRSMRRHLWPMCSSKRHIYLQTLLSSDNESINPLAVLQSSDSLSLFDSSSLSQLIDVNDSFESFYSSVRRPAWSTIISHRWSDPSEHINSLELRAVLLAVHWLLSFPSSHSSRVFLLVDSTVACYSLWKGRSSSPRLLIVLRKISALLLASGVGLLPGWIPSEVNPADEPSRHIADSSHSA